jgi:hypothetical protein
MLLCGMMQVVAEVETTTTRRKSSFERTRSGPAHLAGSRATSSCIFELITWSSEQVRQSRAGCGVHGARCFVGAKEVHVRRSSFYERSCFGRRASIAFVTWMMSPSHKPRVCNVLMVSALALEAVE